MRDRLIELVSKAREKCNLTNCCDCEYRDAEPLTNCYSYLIADQLLESGVIVPPCKVGQTAWYADKWAERVKPIKVISYEICNSGKEEFGCWGGDFTPTRFHVENIGKTVFLTRQEAEQALKGGAE